MSITGNPKTIHVKALVREKCFRMWQVLVGASNMPPDAVQYHTSSQYIHQQLPDIMKETKKRKGGGKKRENERENERERAQHSVRPRYEKD